MGEIPSEIRREIARTRSEMAETIDAIGYKANVSARVKDRVQETVQGTRDSIKHTLGMRTDSASEAVYRSGAATEQPGRKLSNMAQRSPLGLLAGSVAAGFLAGVGFPPSRFEMRTVGPVAGDVRDRALKMGREAMERGRVVAQDAYDAASRVAKGQIDDQPAPAGRGSMCGDSEVSGPGMPAT